MSRVWMWHFSGTDWEGDQIFFERKDQIRKDCLKRWDKGLRDNYTLVFRCFRGGGGGIERDWWHKLG